MYFFVIPGRGFDRSISERGNWFDRGGPGGDDVNGAPPRKGYSRAPYDDWRKPSSGGGGGSGSGGGGGEDEDGWRNSGAGPSGRRWNNPGWRDRESGPPGGPGADPSRRYGGGEYVNGDRGNGPAGGRWKEPEFGRSGRGGRGGHHSSAFGGRKYRPDNDMLPEWASDEPAGGDKGGSFDEAGKFQASKMSNGDESAEELLGGSRHRGEKAESKDDWTEEGEVVEEEVDPDDLPGRKPLANGGQEGGGRRQEADNSAVELHRQADSADDRLELRARQPDQMHSDHQQQRHHHDEQQHPDHLDAGHLVSRLVDDDDPEPNLEHQDRAAFDRQEQQRTQFQHSPSPRQQQEQHLQQQQQLSAETEHVRQQLEDEVASREGHPRGDAAPRNIEWIYLDPQQNIQGPFQNDDMLEWFTGGYFPATLMLRRTCDKTFIPLNELTKIFGGIPFAPGVRQPPPINNGPDAAEEKARQQALLMAQLQQQREQQAAQERQQQLLLLQQQQQQQQQMIALRQQQEQQRQQQQREQQRLSDREAMENARLLEQQNGRGLGGMLSQQQLHQDLDQHHGQIDPLKLLMRQQQQQQHKDISSSGFGLSLSSSGLSQSRDLNLFNKPTPTVGTMQGHPGGHQLDRHLAQPDHHHRHPSDNSGSGAVPYDPIKSLLNQLQADSSDGAVAPTQHAQHADQNVHSPERLQRQQQQQQQQQQHLAGFGGLNSNQMQQENEEAVGVTRSIWDMKPEEHFSPEPRVRPLSRGPFRLVFLTASNPISGQRLE